MIAAAPIVAIASQLAGVSTKVECDKDSSFSQRENGYVTFDWTGTAYQSERTIHLPASTCRRLNRLYSVRDTRPWSSIVSPGGKIVDLQDGAAVHVLAHEAMHIRLDSLNESRVETCAYQNQWQAVRLFHLAAWKTRQILRGMRVAHFDSADGYLDASQGGC